MGISLFSFELVTSLTVHGSWPTTFTKRCCCCPPMLLESRQPAQLPQEIQGVHVVALHLMQPLSLSTTCVLLKNPMIFKRAFQELTSTLVGPLMEEQILCEISLTTTGSKCFFESFKRKTYFLSKRCRFFGLTLFYNQDKKRQSQEENKWAKNRT